MLSEEDTGGTQRFKNTFSDLFEVKFIWLLYGARSSTVDRQHVLAVHRMVGSLITCRERHKGLERHPSSHDWQE